MSEDTVKRCTTCAYVECHKYGERYEFFCLGQKDKPRLRYPEFHSCDRYKNMLYEEDELSENSESPVIEVTTPKKVFNTAYWIIGDVYIIECINTKVRCVYFLRDVSQTGDSICLVATHHKLELTVEEFMSSFNVIKNISKESLIKDVT